MDNKLGVKGPTGLLITAICLGGLGIMLLGGGNRALFLNRAKKTAVVAWIPVASIAVLACLMPPLLLVFLV